MRTASIIVVASIWNPNILRSFVQGAAAEGI
jgi:hypothetical protein